MILLALCKCSVLMDELGQRGGSKVEMKLCRRSAREAHANASIRMYEIGM